MTSVTRTPRFDESAPIVARCARIARDARGELGHDRPRTRWATRAIPTLLLSAVLWLGASACQPSDDGGSEMELRLASFVGPRHPVSDHMFTRFADTLARISNGALRVRVFPGGTLNSSPPRQYGMLLDHGADIAFVVPGYTADLFPKTNVIYYPGVCGSPVDCTEAMWRALPVLEGEYDAKILALWSGAPPVLVTRDRPVRSLEDFRGLRIRVASRHEFPFIEALGAVPVMQPATEIHQNLANGVIDAIAIAPSGITSFNLQDAGRHVTTWLPLSGTPFALLMNRAVYDGLTAEQRGWIDAAADSALSLNAALDYAQNAVRSIAAARFPFGTPLATQRLAAVVAALADPPAARRAATIGQILRTTPSMLSWCPA